MRPGTDRNGRPPKAAAIPGPGLPGIRKPPRGTVREPLRPAATRAMSRGAGSAGSTGGAPPQASGEERRRMVAAVLGQERRVRVEPPLARSGSQGPADVAQEIGEELVRLATLERRRQMLAQTEKALSRLAAGRYGLCADCGNPISPARLQALPFAVRCCPCQERFERRARGGASARLTAG